MKKSLFKVFSNVQFFRPTKPLVMLENIIKTGNDRFLVNKGFTPCGAHDPHSEGWVSPVKGGDDLFFASNGHLLLKMRCQDKLLPESVIKDLLFEKVDEIEAQQNKKLKSKEKAALKEEIIISLLPQAFAKNDDIILWFSPSDNLIGVATASATKAEYILSFLRKTLGSLPVVPVQTKTPLRITMTEWLKEGNCQSEKFNLGGTAELKAADEESNAIKVKDQDMTSDEITAMLNADKVVTSMALQWVEDDSGTDFTLTETFGIKGIKYSTELLASADSDDTSPSAALDAEFYLLAQTLPRFFNDLITIVGGEQEPKAEEEEQPGD